MALRVDVAPASFEWALERSGRNAEEIRGRFPNLESWEDGRARPTLKQLEDFAEATYTPFGYFFLPDPPEETLPLPDFRTGLSAVPSRPSANLLQTIYDCQQRQDWYRAFARSRGDQPLPFVGSLRVSNDPKVAADTIRGVLGFGVAARRQYSSWTEALRMLTVEIENAGALVMVNGVVGSNTHRKLDPQEFRGFVLVDDLAPVIFINGADSKAAQIFTLAHEIAHLWLGQSAVSNPMLNRPQPGTIERWCNDVAAELLVPMASLKDEIRYSVDLTSELSRLAGVYRVSTLVILRRMYDAGLIEWAAFHDAYDAEMVRIQSHQTDTSGGNYYATQPVRVSRRFAKAVIADTLEGRTLYREAFRLLSVKKQATFDGLSESLGVA